MPSIAPLCGVYAIRCNGKVYVGSSSNIEYRWKCHRSQLRSHRHGNIYLQRVWDKYGESAFTFEVLELCLEVVRCDREDYWIQKLKACNRKYGYNIALRAATTLHSAESRAKMSAAKQGRALTPEHRANISAHHGKRGIPLSAQQLQAIRDGTKNRVFTPEARAKISAATKKRWDDPELRSKLRASFHGTSDESREKMRAAWIRRRAKEEDN